MFDLSYGYEVNHRPNYPNLLDTLTIKNRAEWIRSPRPSGRAWAGSCAISLRCASTEHDLGETKQRIIMESPSLSSFLAIAGIIQPFVRLESADLSC